MADQGVSEYWGDKHKPFVPAWTNDDELAALADAIVRGASVCHATVPDLRKLIEAVQAHPGSRHDPMGGHSKPTTVIVRGGDVIECDCGNLTIAVQFTAQTRFNCSALFWKANFNVSASFKRTSFSHNAYFKEANFIRSADFGEATFIRNAYFKKVSFTRSANFGEATFARVTNFRSAMFTGNTSFRKAIFLSKANFGATAFKGVGDFRTASFDRTAYFKETTFTRNAHFGKARFHRIADFRGVAFGGHAYFRAATLTGNALFSSAIFTRKANFGEVKFSSEAYFSDVTFIGAGNFGATTFCSHANFKSVTFTGEANFRMAYMVGVANFRAATFFSNTYFWLITIERRLLLANAMFKPTARITFEDAYLRPGSEITLGKQHIAPERCYDHKQTPWQWVLGVYGSFIPFARPPFSKLLGICAGGSFIQGEDSDEPEEMLRAAADYNRLRDNFRHQSSTDELEDLCHFRYMDLRRRAGDLWKQAGPIKKRANEPFKLSRPINEHLLNLWRPFQWLFMDGILYWLIWRNCLGYLVRPMRPLVTGFLVILLGWAIYAFGASNDTILYNGTLADSQAAMDIWNGTALTPLYFSVTTFTTLGYGDFAPTGWLRLVAGLQALIGVGLIALFTVSWGRKMIR